MHQTLCMCVLSRFSHVPLFATVWTVAHQAPLSMGFSACWADYGSRWTQGPPHLWRNGVGRWGSLPHCGSKRCGGFGGFHSDQKSPLTLQLLPLIDCCLERPCWLLKIGARKSPALFWTWKLKLYMERWTGSKLGKKYIKTVYCHPAYLTYMQSSVRSLSHVQHFVTAWTAARQASLFITNSHSLPKLMSVELVMLSNHLFLCRPLLLLPSIFPSIRVFSNESVLHIRWPE